MLEQASDAVHSCGYCFSSAAIRRNMADDVFSDLAVSPSKLAVLRAMDRSTAPAVFQEEGPKDDFVEKILVHAVFQ